MSLVFQCLQLKEPLIQLKFNNDFLKFILKLPLEFYSFFIWLPRLSTSWSLDVNLSFKSVCNLTLVTFYQVLFYTKAFPWFNFSINISCTWKTQPQLNVLHMIFLWCREHLFLEFFSLKFQLKNSPINISLGL